MSAGGNKITHSPNSGGPGPVADESIEGETELLSEGDYIAGVCQLLQEGLQLWLGTPKPPQLVR